MKHITYLCFACLLVLASGCASNPPIILDAAVGPARPIVQKSPPEGRLVVYSALDAVSVTGGDDNPQQFHLDYKLLSFDGQLLKSVVNRESRISEAPATVSLPPGKYFVVARASSFSSVTVPVVIEVWKATIVHLDGSNQADWKQTPNADVVKLPDGTIIGWRALDVAESK